ncbi:hypothetical protein LQ327_28535 [Actinomycetospora endophytica]|uniref:CYTH domain-containing protein n=1 Tax=Actinomycetospora endophytica TaxID=2291215 RepID=A0ABS8PGC8_9PSEU|nr:hypothetical protein [Actinomycetospora endophytica]MCD2197327.1 hypothetical protein [Actinomycetospora endophytica]
MALAGPAGAAAELLTGRSSLAWSQRRMYLLDTPALDLLRAGVEVRLRGRARGRYDLAVSARRAGPVDEADVPPGARIEIDVTPGSTWQDIEVRRGVDPGVAAGVIGGDLPPGRLLCPAQRGWACHGGHEIVDDAGLEGLVVHGPLVVHRVKSAGEVRVDLEHFRFPGGRELVELSTRCRPEQATARATEFERLLDERGITVYPRYRAKSTFWFADLATRRRIRTAGPTRPAARRSDPAFPG